jgi:hypothetical protein
MKSIFLLAIVTAMTIGGGAPASAQMGMMGGNVPPEITKMMQEQNKALAQASVQYMAAFAQSLYTQAKERREQIDAAFVKDAFAEMKRAHELIDKFQNAHVKTMDAEMQVRVKPMMERMNRNLAAVKMNLGELEKEVNGGPDLDKVVLVTGEILKHLEDIPKRPGVIPGSPAEKPGMGK